MFFKSRSLAFWGREFKRTLALGVPMAGAQLSQLLMTATDVALVGRFQGEGLAAMAVGQAAYGMTLSLGIGLLGAVGPLVSQAHGAKNQKAVAHTVAVGVFVAILCGAVFCPLLYNVDSLFRWLEYPPEMIHLASGYARAITLGLPFAFLFLVQKNYLDAVSRPQWPMVIAFSGVLVNAVVDYLLIFGLWGFPALGVVGTGFATATVNFFMALALLPICWKPDFTRALRETRKKEWKEFFEVGAPIAGSIGMEVGLFAVGALMMGKLGTAEAAAHQIVLVCSATAFMVPLGISFAGSARVGQAVGRRDFQAVRPAGVAAMFTGCGFMVLTAILFTLFPSHLIGIFWDPAATNALEIQGLAIELLILAGIFQISDGLQVTANGSLRGIKDVKIPLLIGGVSYWVVGLGSAVYFTFYTHLRHEGLWLGFVLGLTTAGLALATRFILLSTRVRHDPALQKKVSVRAVS
ncbi:MAG: MATE family efflux transporter [Vulcanimicrobiota bacterium]